MLNYHPIQLPEWAGELGVRHKAVAIDVEVDAGAGVHNPVLPVVQLHVEPAPATKINQCEKKLV